MLNSLFSEWKPTFKLVDEKIKEKWSKIYDADDEISTVCFCLYSQFTWYLIYFKIMSCFITIRTGILQQLLPNIWEHHFMKSVRIRSYSGPYFCAFWLITERYLLSLRIQCTARNTVQKNSEYGHFSRSALK